MLIVADLTRSELRRRLGGDGLRVDISPFVVSVSSRVDAVGDALHALYADYAVAGDDGFVDFHVSIERGRGLRRFIGAPQSRFLFDGSSPFKPLPLAQAYPSFEWGLNWCVANHSHQYLVLHAAVIERGGRAAILAAPPGSGKSTLCAGLVNRGWRLFSDELALIEPGSGELVAFPRPICLKNESIDVIRRFAAAPVFGPVVHDTRKGTVAHLRPAPDDVRRAGERARPAWIVLPRFRRGATTALHGLSKAHAGWQLAGNAFNFSILGETGFAALSRAVDGCRAFDLDYGDLDAAAELFEQLAAAS